MDQTKGFETKEFPNYVYRLNKKLYGLKKAPRAWYSRLDQYPIKNGFRSGGVDSNLYIMVHVMIFSLFLFILMI